jgi:hypothetical protein
VSEVTEAGVSRAHKNHWHGNLDRNDASTTRPRERKMKMSVDCFAIQKVTVSNPETVRCARTRCKSVAPFNS